MRRLLALCLALALALSAPAARAQWKFDPTGNSGNDPAVTLNLTALGTNIGVAHSQGGGSLAPGKPVVVRFQCQVGNVGTPGKPSALVGGPEQELIVRPAAGGFVGTGRQFVLTGLFRAKVSSVSDDGTAVVFAPDLNAGPNLVSLYGQSCNDPNSARYDDAEGVGYDPQPCPQNKVLILQGNVNPKFFTSSFVLNKASLSAPVPLNQHAAPGTSYAGVKTPVGSGNTSLTVDVTFADPRYWPRPDRSVLPFKTLHLAQIPSATPITGCEPPARMFDGTAPNLGPVNGQGADVLVQVGPCSLAPGD